MTRTKHDIVTDMAIEEAKMLASLRRLREQTIELAGLVPEEPTRPPVDPVDPPVEPERPEPDEFGSAKDRYNEDWGGSMSVYVDDMTTPESLLLSCRDVHTGIVPDRLTISIDAGTVVEGMWIGGGHKYAISNADGSPLKNLRVMFGQGSRVDGFKIGTSRGGMEGELRLVNPRLRADDRDVGKAEFIGGQEYVVEKQGDEEAVTLEEEEAMHNGASQGDFAPLRVLDHMPMLHIVAINTIVEVDPSWVGYDGMGIKWAVFLKKCMATFDGITADSAREHTFYQNNTGDLFRGERCKPTQACN